MLDPVQPLEYETGLFLVATLPYKLIWKPDVHVLLAGVEDFDNFHGKALGDKGKDAVQIMKAQLSSGENSLERPPVVEDAPKIGDLKVKLSQPPSYKLGDQVHLFQTLIQYII